MNRCILSHEWEKPSIRIRQGALRPSALARVVLVPGTSVVSSSPLEAQFLYEEIHERECYLGSALQLSKGDTVIDVGPLHMPDSSRLCQVVTVNSPLDRGNDRGTSILSGSSPGPQGAKVLEHCSEQGPADPQNGCTDIMKLPWGLLQTSLKVPLGGTLFRALSTQLWREQCCESQLVTCGGPDRTCPRRRQGSFFRMCRGKHRSFCALGWAKSTARGAHRVHRGVATNLLCPVAERVSTLDSRTPFPEPCTRLHQRTAQNATPGQEQKASRLGSR